MAITTDSVRAHRMFDLWMARKTEAEQVRQFYSPYWDEAIDFFMNYPTMEMPPGAEWMHATLLPEFFSATEGLVAQYARHVFDNPRSFSVEAPTLQGRGVQRQVEAMLRAQRRASSFVERSMYAVRMGFIQGHIIQKNTFLRQMETKWLPLWSNPQIAADGSEIPPRILGHEPILDYCHNGPWTDYPDLQRIWKSPATDWKGQPLWWIESLPYDISLMHEQNRNFYEHTGEHLYRQAALKNLTSAHSFARVKASAGAAASFAPPRPSMDMWERSTTSTASGAADNTLSGADTADLVQCWGYVPRTDAGGHTYDDTQYRVQLFTPAGELLRDEPQMYTPYNDVFFIRMGQEPYGRTPMQWTINDIEQMSEIRNLSLAETWINILGGFIADRSVDWDQADLIKTPGFVWFYDGDGRPPSQVLEQVKKQAVMPDAYHAVNDGHNRVQRISGATQNAQGGAYGARTSAFEAHNIQQQAGGRTFLQAGLLAWQLEQRAMQSYYKLDQLFLEEGAVVQLEGEPEATRRIFGHDLDFDIDIYVDAHTFGSLDSIALEGLSRGLGMFMADPEARAHLDIREAMDEFFYRFGSPRVEKVLKSEKQVQAEQQAALENQMVMAALSNGGQQPPQ